MEIIVTIGSKNRVTLPIEVRRRLGVDPSDEIAFVLGEGKSVGLRKLRFDLESILGSIPALPGESLDLEREIEEATEEEMQRLMRRWSWNLSTQISCSVG
jgi:bifunctional DNA-binding transcriptional regulator/antitoxin component of YhaV-PrlF toxin-antitoxin module